MKVFGVNGQRGHHVRAHAEEAYLRKRDNACKIQEKGVWETSALFIFIIYIGAQGKRLTCLKM